MIGWGTSLYNTLWCMYITNYYYRLVIGLFWEREFMIYEWLTWLVRQWPTIILSFCTIKKLFSSINFFFSFIQGTSFELDDDMCPDDDEREAMQEIINNAKISEGYLTLARDIEVMEPKSPEDIYKVISPLLVTVISTFSLYWFPSLKYFRHICLMAELVLVQVLILLDKTWLLPSLMLLWMLALVR